MKGALQFLATALLIILTGCSNSKIEESKIIGSWRWELPGSFVVVSTYNADHTFLMTFPNDKRLKDFQFRGEWKLKGSELSSMLKAASGTKEIERQNAVLFPPDLQKVKIVHWSDSQMNWRGETGNLKLTRVKN